MTIIFDRKVDNLFPLGLFILNDFQFYENISLITLRRVRRIPIIVCIIVCTPLFKVALSLKPLSTAFINFFMEKQFTA